MSVPLPEASAVLRSGSAEETRALGRTLGELLAAGDFVGLVGDLGAGKTELVRGVAAGAGVPASEVTSPSFALVNTYAGRLTLHHVDVYRLADEDELYAMGYDDLLQSGGALVVEWVDKIARALPDEHLRITILPDAGDARTLNLEARGERPAALLRAWVEACSKQHARGS